MRVYGGWRAVHGARGARGHWCGSLGADAGGLSLTLEAGDGDLRSRVTVKRGDMRRVKLKRRFDLVLCTFNTWLHLYVRQDVERYCARVRRSLERGWSTSRPATRAPSS